MTDETQPVAPETPRQPNNKARDDSSELSPKELAEARQYGHLSLKSNLMDKGLDFLYLFLMATLFARPINQWLSGSAILDRCDSLRLVALFLILTLLHALVSLPLSFKADYLLEHQFGLSNLTLGGWAVRYLKRLALATAFGAAIVLGLYWIIWTTGSWWWLVAAAAFFLVSVILGQLMPVVILPLFYKIERLDAPELADRFGRLSRDTGLSIEGVYRIALSEETVKANAMLAGLGRTRRVLLGDTLLDKFSPDEIEVIFAHEVGHHVFNHIYKLIGAGLLFTAVGFWLSDRALADWVEHAQGVFRYAQLPVFALPMLLLILAAFGAVVGPLQNAVSRHFERQCDRYALERTGKRAAFVAAFRKLARLNKDNPDPHWLEVALFRSHPPIGERVALAKKTKSP
ncbi:MAG: M48 family metallopeptidase [Pirellulales bacterium]|nr:M48 family metallopeptidase [Pirellulales bacterium]